MLNELTQAVGFSFPIWAGVGRRTQPAESAGARPSRRDEAKGSRCTVQRFHIIATLAGVALLGAAMAATTVGVNAAPTFVTAGPAMLTPPPRENAPAQFPIPARLETPPPRPTTLGPALDGRYLRARRTPTGYTLSGQALAKDACQAARFDRVMGTIFPPEFTLGQFRRPGTLGLLCIQRLTWVTVPPLMVASQYPPNWITVRTQKHSYRVSIR